QEDAGIEAMRTAATKAPGLQKYGNNLGVALLRVRRFEESVATLAPLVPKEAVARANTPFTISYAEALIGVKRRDEARAVLNSVLSVKPDSLAAILVLGELELGEGRRDKARELLDRASRIAPNSSRAIALRKKLEE